MRLNGTCHWNGNRGAPSIAWVLRFTASAKKRSPAIGTAARDRHRSVADRIPRPAADDLVGGSNRHRRSLVVGLVAPRAADHMVAPSRSARWLAFLSTYRTVCLAPQPNFRDLFRRILSAKRSRLARPTCEPALRLPPIYIVRAICLRNVLGVAETGSVFRTDLRADDASDGSVTWPFADTYGRSISVVRTGIYKTSMFARHLRRAVTFWPRRCVPRFARDHKLVRPLVAERASLADNL